MALPIKNINKLHKSLEYNFLYNNDPNSIHLLLSMLENESRLKRFRPKYTCMRSIKSSVSRYLKYRRDREMIIMALNRLINDDINRLELAVYIESYSNGFQNDYWANRLENFAFKNLPIEEICNRSYLFHDSKNRNVVKLKNELDEYLNSDKLQCERLRKITFTYCEKVIKRKIYKLNEYMDSQLVIDCIDDKTFIAGEEFLTIPELTGVYQRVISSYMTSIMKIHRTAYWFAINDRVLNRY